MPIKKVQGMVSHSTELNRTDALEETLELDASEKHLRFNIFNRFPAIVFVL